MNRVADRIDLTIDMLTLGQYGLERIEPRDRPCCGPDLEPCPGGRSPRLPRHPSMPGRADRRRGIAHDDYEWGWPTPDADPSPSPSSSLWALANA